MNHILDKIDRLQKHDAFSDLRNNFFSNTLGLSQNFQDAATQGLNLGKNLLPKGGAVGDSPIENANQSQVISTYPGAMSQIFGPKIAGIPIVVLIGAAAIGVIIWRKK